MRSLKISIISLLLINIFSTQAMACGWDAPERWFMFCFCENTFRSEYDQQMNSFWQKYCGEEWYNSQDMMKAAQRKGDTEMQNYINELMLYEDICEKMGQDKWDYPTAQELNSRKQILRSIVSSCSTRHGLRYGERWILLQMRANMLRKNHEANKTLWLTKGKNLPASIYKEMMRNIYANALLSTGDKQQAWNIYAEQNDQQSLLWTVRKFTNLAGIKSIYATDPNAPVMNYLLQQYVNQLQDIIDHYNDNDGNFSLGDYDQRYDFQQPAYAFIDKDYMQEIKNFISFSYSAATSGKTNNPCMWMSASALVSYFLNDYNTAKTRIDQAMEMNGTEPVKKMARRIRMLISASTSDIRSQSFKQFITEELRWLNSDIAKTNNERDKNARDRIINLGLAKQYEKLGDKNMAIALYYLQSCYDRERFWDETKRVGGKYVISEGGFYVGKTATDMERYFAFVRNHGDNPLAQFVFSEIRYDENYINDMIGTRHIAESNFEKALPYISKVQQTYLNKQNIAHYAYYRTYKTPAWDRFQVTGDELPSYNLNGNIKLRFCNDMINLQKEYKAAATQQRRQELALTLATYYYQASYRGQCWFISDYSYSAYHEESECKPGDFVDKARKLLAEAAQSTNKAIKSSALFGLAGSEWDYWAEVDYDYSTNRWTYTPLRNSRHYAALSRLDSHLRSCQTVSPAISRCDVLKKFRRHR